MTRSRRFPLRGRGRVVAGLSLVFSMVLTLAVLNQTARAASKITLTFWENYGTQQSLLDAANNLVGAYEKLHPDVTIKLVNQPADNYFALVQASAISHTGPDLVVMWTGLYIPPYVDILANLRPYLSQSTLNGIGGLQWGAEDFDASKAILAMPVDAQFYMGFYNKKAFATAGIKQVPRNWSELFAACALLKRAGIIPVIYGSGSASYSGEFNPWYSFSYLMIGALKPAQWQNLYSGAMPWTSSVIQAQLAEWHDLYVQGCVNKDALTNTTNLEQFISGKAAMTLNDGSWDVGQFSQEMGSNVGAIVPPFSTAPQSGVVYFPGDAISVMKESPHIAAAADFLAFMDSPAGAIEIAKAGLIPTNSDYNSTNALNREMLDFVQKDGYTVYPMLDNVTQPDIVNAGYQVLPAVLAGQSSIQSALQVLQSKLHALPAKQRSTYAAYFSGP
jgi:ABC-type glycerol-3-phosphate transport system substrate-binding protein